MTFTVAGGAVARNDSRDGCCLRVPTASTFGGKERQTERKQLQFQIPGVVDYGEHAMEALAKLFSATRSTDDDAWEKGSLDVSAASSGSFWYTFQRAHGIRR